MKNMSDHKHMFSRLDFIPNFCWKCGVAEIDGAFYYPSFQFDKLKEQNEKLKEALEKIQNPVLYLQKQAEASGANIDGLMAVALSKDCEWLKNIAYEALKIL